MLKKYLEGKLFTCVFPFLTWLKVGEKYSFEYKGRGKYEVTSDNANGKTIEMGQTQFLKSFAPDFVEKNTADAILYGFWLAEAGFDGKNLSPILGFYLDKSEDAVWTAK